MISGLQIYICPHCKQAQKWGEHTACGGIAPAIPLAAAPAPVAPAGWTLVPVEPTPAMVSAYLAGNAAYWKAVDDGPKHPAKWRNGTPAEATAEGYRAMLAAAPAATAPVAQGEPVALLWRVRRALALAMRICDRVPNRWHYTHEIGSAEADIGDMVNAHPDGTHGYREIQEAGSALVAYLTTPEAASAPVALTPAQQHADELLAALTHLHHNARASGAEMGLALDVAGELIAKVEATGQEGGA